MRLPHIILLVLLTLLVVQLASAAMLQGTIYREDLSVAKDVLVTIDTQPEQRLLSVEGTYEFMVPPGNYTLQVHDLNGGLNDSDTDNVTVAENGTFTYDLFLFPNLENLEQGESIDLDSTTEFNATSDFQGQPATPGTHPSPGPWPVIVLILVILILLIVPYAWLRRRFKRLGQEQSPVTGTAGEEAGDEKLNQVLKLLKEAGGRMTQKELRQKVPDSEAKVSLMIAELETQGKITKIKKGRANIIVLKR